MTWSCDWLRPQGTPHGVETAWTPAPVQIAVDAGLHESELLAASEEDAFQAQLRDAYEHGRADGWREATAGSSSRVQAAVEALAMACEELHELREPLRRDAREHLTALATAIAQHVIEREVRTDPNIIADLVRRALASFPLGEAVRIRVHPEDLSTLSLGRAGGELKLAPGRQAEWVADDSVTVGSCLVEGPRRVVDGRVRQVLERIYEVLNHA